MNETVNEILAKSALDVEDRELWLEYLKWAPSFLTERFVELFKDDYSDLPEMTLNLRQKIAATSDHDLAQVILDKEIETLKKYFNN